MPLIKRGSKKAFEQNMKSEMNAGKPQDQSLAIAYEIQRKNKRKPMAKGGMIPMPEERREEDSKDPETMRAERQRSHNHNDLDQEHHFAKGGMVDDDDAIDSDTSHMSLAERILDQKAKEKEQSFIEMNGKEMPNDYYHLNEHEALDENLDSDMFDVEQPMDSNEHGDRLSDEDSHDMVSKIRSKIKFKRGM